MKPYLAKTPEFVQRIFPKRTWAFPNTNNTVYLTFDDGPIPEVTPWVLSELKKHEAKATFFCIGDNIEKNPDILSAIEADGHAIGNHTFNHLNGRKTPDTIYHKNIQQAESALEEQLGISYTNTRLFRPPYGKLRPSQAKKIQLDGYQIIMWDVLSADFDLKISEEKCLQNVLKNIQAGSIVVFHDSLKAKKRLSYALPKVLNFISEKGWKCKPIEF